MAGYFKALKSAVAGSEEAPYEVIGKHQNFEERSYPAMKWVCTKRKAKSRTEVQKDMFMTLFAYINGKNEPNAKIDMTVPVTVHYAPCDEEKPETAAENGEVEKPASEEKEESKEDSGKAEDKSKKDSGKEGKMNEYTMGFYIPKALQENPPKPTDPEVFIEERPSMSILTRTFGGYPKDSQWENEKNQLAELLKGVGDLKINEEDFFTAGYDPPFKPLFRRNEVWLLKTGGSVAVAAAEPKEAEKTTTEDAEEKKPDEGQE